MMFQCCVGNVLDSLDVLRCFVNLIPIPLCLSKSVLLLQNLFAFVFFFSLMCLEMTFNDVN